MANSIRAVFCTKTAAISLFAGDTIGETTGDGLPDGYRIGVRIAREVVIMDLSTYR